MKLKLFKSLKNQATEFLDKYKQRDPATFAAAQQAIGGVLILDGLVGIDNPFGQNKRPGIIGSLLLVGFGVVFMFIPTFFSTISGTKTMTATTEAQVVSVGSPVSSSEGGSTCSLVVEYSVDGKAYQSPSSMSSSSSCQLRPGETVTVNYDPEKPSRWTHDKEQLGLFLMIFFVTGLVVAISGAITFLLRLLSMVLGWKLLRSGRALAATLPSSTSLDTIINEVKRDFVSVVFGMGAGGAAAAMMPTQNPSVETLYAINAQQPTAPQSATPVVAANPTPPAATPQSMNPAPQAPVPSTAANEPGTPAQTSADPYTPDQPRNT